MKDFGSQDPKPTFLHKDYLGSILAITDTDGNVLESRHFDAWGILTHGEIKLLDRGYTSHEHLQDVGLIHMNGRLYDPLMRRFLNADENIQDPYNTQNYNKYGYVLNNPLMFNDPSGEWIHILIGAVIGGVVNWAMNGCQFNAKGLGYFGVGALAGALTAMGAGGVSSALAGGSFSAGALGTSAALTATSSFFTGAVIGASGGLVGGFTTGFGNALINGQNIGQALGSGARDGLVGALTGGVIGGIAGGIDAVRDGRRFWDGAGECIDYVKVPTNSISDGGQYRNNPEMRADYNTNIGARDGMSLEQVEGKLNTTVYLAQDGHLPHGVTLGSDGMLRHNDQLVGGFNYARQDGWLSGRTSQIVMSPGIKGYDLHTRNMIFKHEFMHAWHWNAGFSRFNTYSERATSAFSEVYSNAFGFAYSPQALGYYPEQYNWRNFGKIIPLWIK